jgi:HAD superfamily hydrolase (TIGR01549 family)
MTRGPASQRPNRTLAVDLVCLDAGGVLLFPHWGRVSGVLARHGIEVEPAALAAADHHAKFGLDRAEVLGATDNARHGWLYLQAVLEHAGAPSERVTPEVIADLRAEHAERSLWEVKGSHVSEALERVHGTGVRLGVVSNSDGRLRQLLDAADLTRWFDLVVDSHDVGFEKPDPRLFHFVVERLGVEPARAVHVGDLYQVDVVGARAAGLGAVLLDPASLYVDIDCPRVASLLDLPAVLTHF